jgi:hypothetical protein
MRRESRTQKIDIDPAHLHREKTHPGEGPTLVRPIAAQRMETFGLALNVRGSLLASILRVTGM